MFENKICRDLRDGKVTNVDYDMGKYDWDKIAKQVDDVYKGLLVY